MDLQIRLVPSPTAVFLPGLCLYTAVDSPASTVNEQVVVLFLGSSDRPMSGFHLFVQLWPFIFLQVMCLPMAPTFCAACFWILTQMDMIRVASSNKMSSVWLLKRKVDKYFCMTPVLFCWAFYCLCSPTTSVPCGGLKSVLFHTETMLLLQCSVLSTELNSLSPSLLGHSRSETVDKLYRCSLCLYLSCVPFVHKNVYLC